METQHVEPKTIAVWRWHAAFWAAFFAVPIVGIAIDQGTIATVGGLSIYLVLAVACCWFLPLAHYRRLKFGVDDRGIRIERGIWWRSRIALPRVRVQHSDVSQGPLQRRYGVATLKLYTAGSRYTKIELAGLKHDDATSLRDSLIAHGGDSGV